MFIITSFCIELASIGTDTCIWNCKENSFGGEKMKKRMRSKGVILVLAVIMAFFVPNYAHAEEGTILPKYYREIVEGIDVNPLYIFDRSKSMEETFAVETQKILYNLSETDTANRIELDSSKLWLLLSKVSKEYHNFVLISDLWDTSDETLNPASDMRLKVMVPYFSDNEEAMEHIDDVILNEILPYWTDSEIFVIYLDGVVDAYDNESMRD